MRARIAISVLLMLSVAASAGAQTAAPGYLVEPVSTNFSLSAPTALALLPAPVGTKRLLVADQPGRVWLVENGVQRTPALWESTDEVSTAGDFGLLGIAVDPAFATNRFIYLLYSVDPDSNGVDDDIDTFGRLIRVRLSTADPPVVEPGSRAVLVGTSWSDANPVGGDTHTVGALRFGEDGTLLASCGEGAHWEQVDSGFLDTPMFEPGRVPQAENIGAFRARMTNSLGGKIWRLDPATGHGLPSNPFWTGNGADKASKVWEKGLRNPFRFALRPGSGNANPALGDPGTLFIADVGWERFEELNVAPGPGLNFGWPCKEGFANNNPYQQVNPASNGCDGSATTPPVAAFHSVNPDSSSFGPLRSNALSAIAVWDAPGVPAAQRGKLLLADLLQGELWLLTLDGTDHPVAYETLVFDLPLPVDLLVDPANGDIFVACLGDAIVRRVRRDPAVDAPAPQTGSTIALSGPRPNPAHGEVAWTLRLPGETPVSFRVLDVSGREVWRAPAMTLGRGDVRLVWPGRLADGRLAPPAVYTAEVVAGGERFARQVSRLP